MQRHWNGFYITLHLSNRTTTVMNLAFFFKKKKGICLRKFVFMNEISVIF